MSRPLPQDFVRAVLDDVGLTDSLMDALEARVIALEEVAAARGVRRLSLTWRLGRSLRASVRNFAGCSFAERRYEAASAEWGCPGGLGASGPRPGTVAQAVPLAVTQGRRPKAIRTT